MASEKSANPKEDFLEEDPEIRSQKFVLLSFLSPESVLDSKDKFFFGEFVIRMIDRCARTTEN